MTSTVKNRKSTSWLQLLLPLVAFPYSIFIGVGEAISPSFFVGYFEFFSPLTNPVINHISIVQNAMPNLIKYGYEDRIPFINHVYGMGFILSVYALFTSIVCLWNDVEESSAKELDFFNGVLAQFLVIILLLFVYSILFVSGNPISYDIYFKSDAAMTNKIYASNFQCFIFTALPSGLAFVTAACLVTMKAYIFRKLRISYN